MDLFVQDGATNGGFKASGARGPFGSLTQLAVAESAGANGETLTTGVTTYTTTLQLPAGYKFIMGAGWRVGTTITGITTIDFGVTGSPTYFAASPIAEPDGGQHGDLQLELFCVSTLPRFRYF